MKKLHKEIYIYAPREKVWETMLGEKTYKEWTMPFSPDPSTSSRAEGNWEERSKMLFIGTDENGVEGGMVSRIKVNRRPGFLSIEHLGIYKDGVEDTESEEAKAWAPAYENYTLNEKDGGTQVIVDMDIDEAWEEMFNEMWPKALQILKEISER